MNREYNEKMDELRFSKEQKASMVQSLLDADTNAPRRKARRGLSRMAAAGVAAALVLSIGAGGAAVYNRLASDSFAGVFGTAQTEVIDKIGRPIGASVTKNGLTITADAIIGDQYNACIVYTIEREDGSPIGLPEGSPDYYLHFEEQSTDLRSGNGGTHGSAGFTDDDPSDNKVQYVETVSADAPLRLGTAKAHFKNLSYYDDTTEGSKVLIEGDWKLKFEVNYEDTSIAAPAGQTFTQNGMNFTVNGISLSPVALRVDYEVDAEVDWGEAESGRESDQMRREHERFFENVQILVVMKDGTVHDLSLAGGSIKPEDGKTYCVKGEVFEEILPIEEVEKLVIGGVDIALK